MILEVCRSGPKAMPANWEPAELELERILFLTTDDDSRAVMLNDGVFGEPILLLKRQVVTKQGKRADLVGIDRQARGVFIELKKGVAKRGVETQALQYLANYATLKGEQFLGKFKDSKPQIDQFLQENEIDRDRLNRSSRIFLLARAFDESIFSMGEWLAQQGVAFRCIQYQPFKVNERSFLSFSIRFDRSREPIYQLSWEQRSPGRFWHNIGFSPIDDSHNSYAELNAWWQHQVAQKMISASFTNEPGDEGERILNGYIAKDRILAYASRHGAIGWGVVDSPTYDLVTPEYDRFATSGLHRHRLKGIVWKNVAGNVEDAIGVKELKAKFGLAHPIQTKSAIDPERAEALISEMKKRFQTRRETS